jgi:serine O-acetyltransferase
MRYAVMNNSQKIIIDNSNEIPQKINSYLDYLFFLEADRLSLGRNTEKPRIIFDEIWKFQRLLRKVEYYKNCKKSIFSKLPLFFNYFLFHRLSMKLGFSIPPNCFGPGLAIVHRGTNSN